MRLSKYQALGNDYLIYVPDSRDPELGRRLTPAAIRRICDRHYGMGADGILLVTVEARDDVFQLRILNPDGSEGGRRAATGYGSTPSICGTRGSFAKSRFW